VCNVISCKTTGGVLQDKTWAKRSDTNRQIKMQGARSEKKPITGESEIFLKNKFQANAIS